MLVLIPYKYGTTKEKECEMRKYRANQVLIPYRYGTTCYGCNDYMTSTGRI